MDTIWDLNLNSIRITSPSVPWAPRRHWQLDKGLNKVAISSQFPSALPQFMFKRTLTFLWLAAVCLEREAFQGQTATLKSAWSIKNMLAAVHTEIIYIPLLGQLTQICCWGVLFFKYVSPSVQLTCFCFATINITDYKSVLPLAHPSNRPPCVSRLSDKPWANGFSWAGIWQSCSPAAQEAAAVLSTLFHKRWLMGCFSGHWEKGRSRYGETLQTS